MQLTVRRKMGRPPANNVGRRGGPPGSVQAARDAFGSRNGPRKVNSTAKITFEGESTLEQVGNETVSDILGRSVDAGGGENQLVGSWIGNGGGWGALLWMVVICVGNGLMGLK